jgi:tetratricopeptide (TPR) repeat protein
VNPRIPAYLGRVLDAVGTPVGTCFQVSPGVLVTAWHVLDVLGRTAENDVVSVDALNGAGSVLAARVSRTDPLHDLAVLRAESALPGSVVGWFATDWLPMNDSVLVTGVSEVLDPGHEVDYLDAAGSWAGGTTRDRQVPLGRLTSTDVMPGMSGAPVRRQVDDRVVGVVSARYNSADGWLAHSVWVARTEDVRNLLAGIADLDVAGTPELGDAVDLLLSVSPSTVRLTGPMIDVTATPQGVSHGLVAALGDVQRARAAAGGSRRDPTATTDSAVGAGSMSLRRAGRLLAETFLPDPVAEALSSVLRQATREHIPVRIGIDAPDLRGLPWEGMPDPVSGRPLALCPLVTVFRQVKAPKVKNVPGPLRILVAIAAPDIGGGPILDYERELRNVLAAVRAARAGNADVRVVPFATTAAIRAALDQAPAHVLHVSCHGGPGTLDLEDDKGTARPVTAAEFVAEAIPPGMMPPVVCLAACYTDVAGEEGAPSVAAGLIEHGASVVVGTETSVTDWYATALFARVYQDLAQSTVPDIVAAVADARRTVQSQLTVSEHPRERTLAGLDEWSVVTVLAATGSTVVFDPEVTAPVPPSDRRSVVGLLERDYGEFVGRRREQRALPTVLAGRDVGGVVLHGIGGVGKTTLAAELVLRLQFPVVAVLTGELSVDDVLTAVAGAVRRELAMTGGQEQLLHAVEFARRKDEPWRDRFTVLREQVLGQLPVLVVLDNFEDNLTDHQLRDDTLAELLALWAVSPGRSRLLITSRYEFTLPNSAHNILRFSLVGPMSTAETFKLIWSLPALDRLNDDEVERVWWLVGGHPRSLEYLDALLNGGHARYPDVTTRLTNAITAQPEGHRALTADSLDVALAETLTLIADDVLLSELLDSLDAHPGARELLLGASVYREPIGMAALLFQIGDVDDSAEYMPDRRGAEQRIITVLEQHGIPVAEFALDVLPHAVLAQIRPDLEELATPPRPPRTTSVDLPVLIMALAATSLLTIQADGETVFVHRWTASELDRRWQADTSEEELREAHRRAAAYWQWHIAVWPQDRDDDLHDALEARHHLIAANDLDDAEYVSQSIVQRLHFIGSWDHESTLIHDTLNRLARTTDQRAIWLHQLGMLAHARGDYAEAEHHYTNSLTILEELGDRPGTAVSYHQLGTLVHDRGDYTEAEHHYTNSLTIDEELGNRPGIASTYHQLGTLAHARGDYTEAEHHYTNSLTIAEELGDRPGVARSYHQLGTLAHARGDYTEAEHHYTNSLTIKEELGDRPGITNSYHQLGTLARDQGDYTEAERRYTDALTIAEELGDRAGMARSISQRGVLAEALNKPYEAVRRHLRAAGLRTQLESQELTFDIQRLFALRAGLGPVRFAEAAADVLPPEELALILGLMDAADSASD